jgi:hypothetical protein
MLTTLYDLDFGFRFRFRYKNYKSWVTQCYHMNHPAEERAYKRLCILNSMGLRPASLLEDNSYDHH